MFSQFKDEITGWVKNRGTQEFICRNSQHYHFLFAITTVAMEYDHDQISFQH